MTEDARPGRVVKALRQNAGLTRARLAELAKTSVATVRRLEVGRVVPLDDAVRVVAALGESPVTTFARAFEAIRRRVAESAEKLTDLAWNEPEFRQEMREEGFDAHPADWTLKVHFSGGEVRCWSIFSADVDRFWRTLDRVEAKEEPAFFVFSSHSTQVALNLSQVAHAHVLFDPPEPPGREDVELPAVEVLLAGERSWLTFGADLDEPDGDEDGDYEGQLNTLLEHLEMAVPFGEAFVRFADEDGERAVFRVNALSAVAVSQEILWGHDDGFDDEPEGAPPPSEPPKRRRPKLTVVGKPDSSVP
jgi:transcriptional regulator with XRE-family HTH domain